jgi:hypothetical protein
MITAVTTHKIEIFKLFHEHKLHDILKENLILYVDKEDDSEFRNIVDLSKTRIFNRRDIIKFYGDLYLYNAPYCKKMYFINMISEMGLLNDALYMTDDDVLVYDKSFNDMVNSDKIIYDKEPFPKVETNYKSWEPVYNFFKSEVEGKSLHARATNFFLPKMYVKEFSDMFIKKFQKFILILKNEENYIDYLNAKSKSKRGCDWSVFYIEVPFFDVVFSALNPDYFKFIPFYCVTYSELRKIRDKYNTRDNNVIMEYFCKRKLYPQKHPLLHFNVVSKEALMTDSFNYLNSKELKYKNVDKLLIQTPREEKKLRKTSKSLF